MSRNIGVDANIKQIRMEEQTPIPTGVAVGYGFLYEGTDQQIYFLNASGTTLRFHYGSLGTLVCESQSAFSTNSTNYVDFTGMSGTVTKQLAGRCLVTFSGNVSNDTVGAWTSLRLLIDGVDVGNSTNVGLAAGTSRGANDLYDVSIAYITDMLSAGLHGFKLQMRVSSGTGKIREESKYRFSVQELPI